VLQLLSHLVDKLLVLVTEQDGEARYRLLETIRQYGWEKLSESGEAGKFRERHARYYLALAEEAEPELKGKRQVAWLERFERDHDNLRAAMAFLLKRGELEEAARLGWALWLFWGIRAHFAEGRRSMEQVLSAEGSVALPASARAKALYVEGMMANYQGDHSSAESLVEESLGLFRAIDDKLGSAYALRNAGFAALGQGQSQRAIALTEEAVGLFLEEGEKWGAAIELGFLAVAWRNQGITNVHSGWRSEDWRSPGRWARGKPSPRRSIPWRPWRRPSVITSARRICSKKGSRSRRRWGTRPMSPATSRDWRPSPHRRAGSNAPCTCGALRRRSWRRSKLECTPMYATVPCIRVR